MELRAAFPEFVLELMQLLRAAGHEDLAVRVGNLPLVNRCRCGDEFCATFYTAPPLIADSDTRPSNIELNPTDGMIILDLRDGDISSVEVLFRDDVREQLHALLP